MFIMLAYVLVAACGVGCCHKRCIDFISTFEFDEFDEFVYEFGVELVCGRMLLLCIRSIMSYVSTLGSRFIRKEGGIGSGVCVYVGRGLHFVIAKVLYSEGSLVRRFFFPKVRYSEFYFWTNEPSEKNELSE